MNGHIEQQSQRTAAHSERFDTVIIGGGQAGLATGYHLAKRGLPFVILDANERIGDAWRKRWDSLRLFTPARYDGLEGWRFPAPALSFPTKDEMADYLEDYAARFELPVRTGVEVDGLSREGDRFIITSGNRRFEAKHVLSRQAPTRYRRSPPSPTSSIRASCSSIRASTAAHLSFRKAPFWWLALATLERRSLSRCPERIPHTSRANPRDSSLSVTDPLRRGSSSPWCGSSAITC